MSQSKPLTDRQLIKALLQAARRIKREQIEREKALLERLSAEIDQEPNIIAETLEKD